MKRTLHLTSPHMHGPDVLYAQELLASNKFHQNFMEGASNTSHFDEPTAAAVRRAKYELGYPKDKCHAYFDTALEEYLRLHHPTKNLPLLYRRRRRLRLVPNYGAKALAEATRWIGTKEEPPGSNVCRPFTTWYGVTGPWCAEFVSYCLNVAGFKYVSPRNARWAYVPYVVNDARNRRNGLKAIPASAVKPGDLVCYDWDNDGVADHIGFFDGWLSAGAFAAVEGNTGIGNNSNGGEVLKRVDRHVSEVIEFVHCG